MMAVTIPLSPGLFGVLFGICGAIVGYWLSSRLCRHTSLAHLRQKSAKTSRLDLLNTQLFWESGWFQHKRLANETVIIPEQALELNWACPDGPRSQQNQWHLLRRQYGNGADSGWGVMHVHSDKSCAVKGVKFSYQAVFLSLLSSLNT